MMLSICEDLYFLAVKPPLTYIFGFDNVLKCTITWQQNSLKLPENCEQY